MSVPVAQEDFFARVPKPIVYHPDLTGNDVRVYATLSERAGSKRSTWPSVRRIADDIGVSTTTVQKALDKLEQLGLIKVERSGGKVNLYYLPLVGTVSENDTPPDPVYQKMTRTVSETDTELDQGTRRTPKGVRGPSVSTEEIGSWTALEDLFGEVTTATERRRRGKIVKSLNQAGATFTEVKRRAAAWSSLFPSNGKRGPTLTDHALEKWWGQLGKVLEDQPAEYDCAVQGHPEDRIGVIDDFEFCGLCRKELHAV